MRIWPQWNTWYNTKQDQSINPFILDVLAIWKQLNKLSSCLVKWTSILLLVLPHWGFQIVWVSKVSYLLVRCGTLVFKQVQFKNENKFDLQTNSLFHQSCPVLLPQNKVDFRVTPEYCVYCVYFGDQPACRLLKSNPYLCAGKGPGSQSTPAELCSWWRLSVGWGEQLLWGRGGGGGGRGRPWNEGKILVTPASKHALQNTR